MSSPEFYDMEGIKGLPVAKRCALLSSPAKRELLWFIQGLSLRKGGLNALAMDLLKTFPKRLGTETMHAIGMERNKVYTREQVSDIESELYPELGEERAAAKSKMARLLAAPTAHENWDLHAFESDGDYYQEQLEPRTPYPAPWQNLYAQCVEYARAHLPEFLTEFCINPSLEFQAPGEDTTNEERRLMRREFGDKWSWDRAKVGYFQDIVGALFEYKRLHEERVKSSFYLTGIGREIWKQMDAALNTGTMVLIEGLEGRGKTEAVRAWCECHLGVARFMSLKGVSTKTAQFREMAKALGVGHGLARKVSEMQALVEDVLQISGLMPIIDEAHFFFNQGARIYTRPEMLDWIDTALCNPPLPVALITTPQFLQCVERAADPNGSVRWNYRQFRRRCKRFIRLPKKNTDADLAGIAQKLLPEADAATLKHLVGYAVNSRRDLSAVGDVAREARLLAGGGKVTFAHVKQCIADLWASDAPWAEMERRFQNTAPRRRPSPALEDMEPERGAAPADARREVAPRASRIDAGDAGPALRTSRARIPELESEPAH